MKLNFVFLVLFLSTMFFSCKVDDDEFEMLEKATVFSYNKDAESIHLLGTINSKAFDDFKKIAEANPKAKWIYIVNCDGSINDDVNLSLCKYVHENGYNIVLMEDGMIASGGTDFFLAGNYRILKKNTKVGVHAWAGNGKEATDFPVGHDNHKPYINYYVSIGMSQKEAEDFYYFTINSATAKGMHWMTSEELEKYKFENKPESDS